MDKAKTEIKVDKAVDLSFPACDATAPGRPTSIEPPARPVDREAPQDIERAQRDEGHKQ
jgi:hypothetical protein